MLEKTIGNVLGFCVLFVIFGVVYCCGVSLENYSKDVSDTPECQELLRDPNVLEYVDRCNFWSEGKITPGELNSMREFKKEIDLKSKYGK